MCFLKFLAEQFIPITAIIISLFALCISYVSFKRSFCLQVINDLHKEYRSLDMFLAVKDLWIFYATICNSDETILKEKYISKYKAEKDSKNQEETLHFKRRYVSQYFQTAASYYFNYFISKKTMKKIWSVIDLTIIDKILYPIESEAMPKIQAYKPERFDIGKFIPSKKVKNMKRMYDEFSKPSRIAKLKSIIHKLFSKDQGRIQ